LAAAELAGAQAGKSAALAAYPFLGGTLSVGTDIHNENVVSTISHRRGRGRGRSRMSSAVNHSDRMAAVSTNTRTSLATQAANKESQASQTSHGFGFYVQQD